MKLPRTLYARVVDGNLPEDSYLEANSSPGGLTVEIDGETDVGVYELVSKGKLSNKTSCLTKPVKLRKPIP